MYIVAVVLKLFFKELYWTCLYCACALVFSLAILQIALRGHKRTDGQKKQTLRMVERTVLSFHIIISTAKSFYDPYCCFRCGRYNRKKNFTKGESHFLAWMNMPTQAHKLQKLYIILWQ